MVCKHCRTRPARHDKCPGQGWCDCQHRTNAASHMGPAVITTTMQNTAPSDAMPFSVPDLTGKEAGGDVATD